MPAANWLTAVAFAEATAPGSPIALAFAETAIVPVLVRFATAAPLGADGNIEPLSVRVKATPVSRVDVRAFAVKVAVKFGPSTVPSTGVAATADC